MIVVISGSNRPNSNTLKISRVVEGLLKDIGEEVFFIDITQMPPSMYLPASYSQKPPEFAQYQKAIFDAQGILTVVPEYNGSYPGALKYFIDMLKFPESLKEVPAGFVGLGSGEWGGLRPVEHLEMVFQYRSAHLYGRRVFMKHVKDFLDESGKIKNPEMFQRLSDMVKGFAEFCKRVRPQ